MMPRGDGKGWFGPPVWIKRAISPIIVFHFAAILAAVTSADRLRLPEPFRAIRFAALFQPYLQIVFLNNPYRFFAPNPTATVKLYFHVFRQNGTTDWVELPQRANFRSPLVYHRFCKLSQHAARNMRDPFDRRRSVLNRAGQICIASFVRQIAEADVGSGNERRTSPVASVAVYEVTHRQMSLVQARNGWEPTDLRLYRFHVAGRYAADGRRIDDAPIREVRTNTLVAQIYLKDLLPRLSRQHGADLKSRQLAAADEIGVPEPIRAFMAKSPGMLDSTPDEIDRGILSGEPGTNIRESPFGVDVPEVMEGAEPFPL